MLLTRSQLAELGAALREQPVLSVYLSHAAGNPAERRARGSVLVNAIAAIRDRLAVHDHAEREAFEQSVEQLGDELDRALPEANGLGWAAFVTQGGVRFGGTMPVPVPTLARWQSGIWATPYVRALKQHRTVIVAMIDGVSADIYRYAVGALTRVTRLDVHPRGGHADHLGALPREGFHTGTRGASATDLAAQGRVIARDEIVAKAARWIAGLAGERDFVVIGGPAAPTRALLKALSPRVAARALVLPALTRRASEADIQRLVAVGASQLREAEDSALVDQLSERVGAHGAAVAGPAATIDALAAGRVRQMLLTQRYVDTSQEEAERAVDLALDSGAELEIVVGAGAERLDRMAGGIAAQLRYAPRPAPPLVAVG